MKKIIFCLVLIVFSWGVTKNSNINVTNNVVQQLRFEKTDYFNAVDKGDIEKIRSLVNSGLSIDIVDEKGQTGLLRATKTKNKDLIQYYLDNGASLNIFDNTGRTAFIYLQEELNFDYQIIDLFMASTVAKGSKNDQLVLSAYQGITDNILALIREGAKLNYYNVLGLNPLLAASLANRGKQVIFLLNSGAPLDSRTKYTKRSALFFAVKNGNSVMVNYLLDKGLNVDIEDYQGNTVLLTAARTNKLQIADILLKNKAKIDHQNEAGFTALLIAAAMNNNDVVEFLLKNGAKVNMNNKFNITVKSIAEKNKNDKLLNLLKQYGNKN